MCLRHLLFFLASICLSGCFAAYIPEPRLDRLSSSSESAVIAFSVAPLLESEEKSHWNRFKGTNSLGHQYLFPGIPVTRLYFERKLSDVLGEYLLDHPKLGRGTRAITNLSPAAFAQLFGSKSSVFKIDIESFFATAQDFFFLRKAVVDGRINLSLNNSRPIMLEFNSSRFISKASVEVLSELIEESLFNTLESADLPKISRPVTDNSLSATTIVCIFQKQNSEESPCLSKRNISIGVEKYFRKRNLNFVSFRENCPATLPKSGFFLSFNANEIEEEGGLLKLSALTALGDLTNENTQVRSRTITKSEKPDSSSSEPECAAVQNISESLVEEFFHND